MSTTLPSRGWGRRIAVISNPVWVQSLQDIRATQWDPPCLKLGCVWNVLLTLSSYIQFSFLIFKRLLPSKLINSMKTLWLPMYGHDCLGDYKEKKTVIPAKRWQPTICDVGTGASDGTGVTCTPCSTELWDRACVQCVIDTEGRRLSAVTCVHFKYVQFILNYTSCICKQLGNFWKVTTTNYGNTESTSVCCFK